ncbi:uncharacterized protein LOC117332964 [Pecten maximus]|uniref:uncharacterized protein LOC117332964 n=1 Tax=Pecten maximus TaxID=6579 RepID=UPI0014590E14|nr:uncharacterized protein LOC117332964 [Pecten maximus]
MDSSQKISLIYKRKIGGDGNTLPFLGYFEAMNLGLGGKHLEVCLEITKHASKKKGGTKSCHNTFRPRMAANTNGDDITAPGVPQPVNPQGRLIPEADVEQLIQRAVQQGVECHKRTKPKLASKGADWQFYDCSFRRLQATNGDQGWERVELELWHEAIIRKITLDWFCETDGEVICAKCVSTTHRGHYCIQLSEITPQHKQKIREFIGDTERNKITKIQEEINTTEENLRKHLSHFDSIASEVQKQGEKLKEELDLLTAQTLSRLKHLEEENSKLLKGYQNELEKKLEELKNQLKECKESLQNGTDIQVFEIASRLTSKLKLPSYPHVCVVKFRPTAQPKRILEQALGTLTSFSPGQSHGYQKPKNLLDDYESCLRSTRRLSDTSETFSRPVAQTSLLPTTKVLLELKSFSDVCSICPDNDSGLWTCGGDDSVVTYQLSTGDASLKQGCPVKVTDICTSPSTRSLWVCSMTDKSVLEMVSDELIRRFNTVDAPISICIAGTASGDHVLVGMSCKITKFSTKGFARSSTISNNGKPSVITPKRISSCPDSDQIAVADRDSLRDGGRGKPHITVLDQNLQELYQYGQDKDKSRAGKKSFDPWDLKYDSEGRLIISDSNNHCLHALSPNGQYLRLLYTDTYSVKAIGIEVNKNLWAVFGDFGNQTIKCLQYT